MFLLTFCGSQKRSGLQVVASYSPQREYVVTAHSNNQFKQARVTFFQRDHSSSAPYDDTESAEASQRFIVVVTCRRSPASLLPLLLSKQKKKRETYSNVLDRDSRRVTDDCNPPPCPPSELHDPRLHRRPTFSLALAKWPSSKVIFAI